MTVESVHPAAQARVSPFWRAWRWWEKAGSVLAIFGLADLFGQFIKWAGFVHWLVSKYSIAKAWVFAWVPLHIPPEWHDPIVLVAILFSVTNIGFYRRTGKTYTGELVRFFVTITLSLLYLPLAVVSKSIRQKRQELRERFDYRKLYASDRTALYSAYAIMAMASVLGVGPTLLFFAVTFSDVHPALLDIAGYARHPDVMARLTMVMYGSQLLILAMLSGALLAWRWILATLAVFAALVAVNEVYVRWLEPLAAT